MKIEGVLKQRTILRAPCFLKLWLLVTTEDTSYAGDEGGGEQRGCVQSRNLLLKHKYNLLTVPFPIQDPTPQEDMVKTTRAVCDSGAIA